MRPLQVYLDSSDFSTLSSSKRSETCDEVEKKLLAWSDAGLIEIRFSYLHVIEASAIKPEDIPSAAARLQKMLQLCGRKCLTSTISIIEREISHPGEWKSSAYFDWIYRDDGDWLPDIDGLGGDDFSPHARLRREIHESTSDRATRRRMERKWFDQQGKLKPAAKARFRATQTATALEIEERLPLPPRVAQQLAECLAEDNAAKFRSLLRSSLSDLSCWPGWYRDHWNKVDPVSSFLRRTSKALNKRLAASVTEFQQTYSDTAVSRSGLREIYLEAASSMNSHLVEKLSAMQSIEPVATDKTQAWDMRPALTTALSVQWQIGMRNLGLTGRPRKPDDGDFGDVLHCVHLPFVDIFRADGFTASAISEAKLPLRTKIVPKLLQLPEAIEAHLKNQRRI